MRDEAAGMASRLDRIESFLAIAEIVYRCARGWDRRDEEAIRACYWPDARLRHSAFDGSAGDFVTAAFARTAALIGARHLITNPIIEQDGDRALCETYFVALHRRHAASGDDEEDYMLGGRFLDRFERRGGEWRILFRRGLNEVERIDAAADRMLADADPETRGRRKPDDPLYAMLAQFRAGGA